MQNSNMHEEKEKVHQCLRYITLCIPRMETKLSKSFIFTIFAKLNIGFIDSIIEIPLKNDSYNKKVIIKIKWNNSDNAAIFINRFKNGQNVKIMYSDPWYWICIPTRAHMEKITSNAYSNYEGDINKI
jgi:hypothetical protein